MVSGYCLPLDALGRLVKPRHLLHELPPSDPTRNERTCRWRQHPETRPPFHRWWGVVPARELDFKVGNDVRHDQLHFALKRWCVTEGHGVRCAEALGIACNVTIDGWHGPSVPAKRQRNRQVRSVRAFGLEQLDHPPAQGGGLGTSTPHRQTAAAQSVPATSFLPSGRPVVGHQHLA